MSLIGFHRFLIGSAIVFCFGFAVWQFVGFTRDGGLTELLIAIAFSIGGGLLSVYLAHLRRILKLPEESD